MPSAAEGLRAIEPLVGRWRTSGTVLGDDGAAVAAIDGSDDYEWMPGGNWLIHRADVTIGDERVRVLELIGEAKDDGTWAMHAFDGSGSYDTMTLSRRADGAFLLEGDGVRSTLTPAADGGAMTAVWERESAPGIWVRWMDMRFEVARDAVTARAADPTVSGDCAADYRSVM